MNLSPEQKNRLKKILTLLGNQSKLALYIFELEESFDGTKSQYESLEKTIEKYIKDIEALRPVKGKDYYTEAEFEGIVQSVLAKIPVPKDADEQKVHDSVMEKVMVEMKKCEEMCKKCEGDMAEAKREISNGMIRIESELKGEIEEMEAKHKMMMDEMHKSIPEMKEMTATEYRDKLETLEDDEGYDLSKGKGFKELKAEIESLRDEIRNRPMIKFGGAKKVPVIKRYNLTSQCDGATKSFTLPTDTMDVLGVFGTQFPLNFNPGTDWTFSGRTLTLGDSVSAPESGQTLWALIEVLFY